MIFATAAGTAIFAMLCLAGAAATLALVAALLGKWSLASHCSWVAVGCGGLHAAGAFICGVVFMHWPQLLVGEVDPRGLPALVTSMRRSGVVWFGSAALGAAISVVACALLLVSRRRTRPALPLEPSS